MAGITLTGFVIKKLLEAKADMESAIQELFGLDANVSALSQFGKLVGTQNNAIARLWELAQDVYNSFSPDTASGIALDNSVAMTGHARKTATWSTVWEVLRLAPATTVAGGKRVAVAGSDPNVEFALNATVTTPLATAVYGAWITIGAVDVATQYTVTVNGTAHNYTPGAGETAEDIILALAILINAGAQSALVDAALMSTETTLEIYPDITSIALPPTFSIAVSVLGGAGTISLDDTGEVGQFTAVETGPDAAPVGTLTEILDTVGGWNGVCNLVAATLGGDIETDAELRLRRSLSIHTPNSGTLGAIWSKLLDLDYVEAVVVLENITDAVDAEGLPPHSMNAIVDIPADPTGVLDASVATAIWETKPLGIATHGGTTTDIVDEYDFTRHIKWDRPTTSAFDMRITYTLYDEEIFPTDGQAQIAALVVAQALILQNMGKDVIPARYIGSIYAGVDGIGEMLIEVRTGALPFATTTIPIAWTVRATLAVGDVSFVVIP